MTSNGSWLNSPLPARKLATLWIGLFLKRAKVICGENFLPSGCSPTPASILSILFFNHLDRKALIEIKKSSYCEKDKIDVLALEKIENTTSVDN